jgi:glycosyltransferase involved in cell wall biosynthesis
MSRPPSALFHYSILNIGGAENSTLRLMRLLLDHGWNVDLVLNMGGGPNEAALDPRITVTHLTPRARGGEFVAARGWRKLLHPVSLAQLIAARAPALARAWRLRRKEYDVAIVSLQGLSPWLVCDVVRARRRIQWIRNDLAECDPQGRAVRNIARYSGKIDSYACVSETARRSLIAALPGAADKATTVYNVIDAEAMRAAAEGAADPFPPGNGLKILTVCRLSDVAKGLFRMLEVHQRLIAEGSTHCWYVLGDGPDRARLQGAIEAAGMQSSFILLGAHSNPFPWFRHADLVAVLSRYEGLCGVVNEAKILGRPVIATRFSGIGEQIGDGRGGLIVENDFDAILEGMRTMLNDDALRARMTNTALNPAIADDAGKAALFARLAGVERLVSPAPIGQGSAR